MFTNQNKVLYTFLKQNRSNIQKITGFVLSQFILM